MMKEFIATLHTYLGDKHVVVVQVEQQADLVNITANVSGEKTTFTQCAESPAIQGGDE